MYIQLQHFCFLYNISISRGIEFSRSTVGSEVAEVGTMEEDDTVEEEEEGGEEEGGEEEEEEAESAQKYIQAMCYTFIYLSLCV